MPKIKQDNRLAAVILGMIMVLLIMGFSGTAEMHRSVVQNKMRYEGTNSLYIELKDSVIFNWITSEEESGVITLKEISGRNIESGQTKRSKVHRYAIAEMPGSDFVLEFGALDGHTESLKIHVEPEKRESYYYFVDSVFVVGDVHGRYDQLTSLLENSGVVDQDHNWTAGKSHLVFLGDLFDRGDDVTKVLWFIYQLEEKAAKKGGKVHLVLGNHEIMTMTKDLRYLGRKERAIAIAYKTSYEQLYHPTKSFLGSWLRSKPSVLKIDDLILAHGGVLDLRLPSIGSFNDSVHAYMGTQMFLDIMKEDPDSTKYDPMKWLDMRYFFYATDNPFWFRGYVEYDTLGAELDQMLKKYDSKIHVVAHTPVETITQKYRGKLLTTDLEDAATELLLLVKGKRQYKKFKVDSDGLVSDVPKYVAPVVLDTLATYDPGR